MKNLEPLFDELIDTQRKKVLSVATRIMGPISEDDLLQPNDFPELESHPLFRYEEGVLEGLHTARMAYLALQKEKLHEEKVVTNQNIWFNGSKND